MPFEYRFLDDEPDETSDLPLLKRIVSYPKRLHVQFLRQMVRQMVFGRSKFWRLMYKCYFSNPLHKLILERRKRNRKLQLCVYKLEECYENYRDYVFSQIPIPSPGQLLKRHRLPKPNVLNKLEAKRRLKNTKRNLNRELSNKDFSDEDLDELLDAEKQLSAIFEEALKSIEENDRNFKLYYNDTAKSLYKSFTVINN